MNIKLRLDKATYNELEIIRNQRWLGTISGTVSKRDNFLREASSRITSELGFQTYILQLQGTAGPTRLNQTENS